MKGRSAAGAYRLLAGGIGILGVILNVGGANNLGTMLSYFTIQSNILAAAMMTALGLASLAGRGPEDRAWYPYIKGAVTMAITVTFLVYNLVLRPVLFSMGAPGGFSLSNELVHVVTPLLVVADWAAFDRKGRCRWQHPLAWAGLTLLYPCYVALFVLCGGSFPEIGGSTKVPYFFMDYERYGWGTVLFWLALMLLAFMALSYIAVGLDRALGSISEKRKAEKV